MAVVKYAKSGSVHIAYRVTGESSRDVVLVPGAFSHLEVIQEDPGFSHFVKRVSSFARVIAFDKRGQGLSDRAVGVPTLEQRMDDVRAVMAAAGSEQATILGFSEGGALAALFAAAQPARTSALVLMGARARFVWAPDYPWGVPAERVPGFLEHVETHWGEGTMLDLLAPSRAGDEAFRQWWGKLQRMSASPAEIVALMRVLCELDIRDVLPTIRVPTLVLNRKNDRACPVEAARDLARRIPGAKFVELAGADHWPFTESADEPLDEMEEFVTGTRRGPEPDRVLATVMFVDIVGSTAHAAKLGDLKWRNLLERFYETVGRSVKGFGGQELGKAGDGMLASFNGPARAVRCAMAVREAVGSLGLSVRAGVHTGECEIIADTLSGIAVHVGARICELAGRGEVLVSSTVKDLVAGSGLIFTERGAHSLKGVPDQWRLFAAG